MKKTTFKCDACARCFKNRSTLNNHVSRSRRGLVSSCAQPAQLQAQLQLNVCNSCQRQFKTPATLRGHRVASEAGRHKCCNGAARTPTLPCPTVIRRRCGYGRNCCRPARLWQVSMCGIRFTMMAQVNVVCALLASSTFDTRRQIFLGYLTSGKVVSSCRTPPSPSKPGSFNTYSYSTGPSYCCCQCALSSPNISSRGSFL